MRLIKIVKNLLRPIKNVLMHFFNRGIKFLYTMLPNVSIDFLLNRKIFVQINKNKIFSLRNMGFISRKRAETFFTKEPETIEWIDGFSEKDKLLDIGANVGIYSLYAATKKMQVVALEPQAMNFALLVLNIMDNRMGNYITAYPFCAHKENIISNLKLLDGSDWGTANSSFDRSYSSHGKEMIFDFEHGSYGLPIDELLEKIDYKPNHIKIDVDGNELLVLLGASNTLRKSYIKSILIELAEDHTEYTKSIEIMKEAGFIISRKGKSHGTLANYIFTKN